MREHEPRDELLALVRREVAALLAAKGAPVFDSVRYWRHGLPQPDLGHAGRIAALRELEQEYPGLVVTGNYVAGVSTAACIDSALAAATRLNVKVGAGDTALSERQRIFRRAG